MDLKNVNPDALAGDVRRVADAAVETIRVRAEAIIEDIRQAAAAAAELPDRVETLIERAAAVYVAEMQIAVPSGARDARDLLPYIEQANVRICGGQSLMLADAMEGWSRERAVRLNGGRYRFVLLVLPIKP